MAAATRVVVTHGLSAPTAMIAQEAGVGNGSLFTYFETKAVLFNQLYLALKTELGSAAMEKLPAEADLPKQAFHVWSNWMGWAVSNPHKLRALAQLNVSEEITPATRAAAQAALKGLAALLERMRADGPLRNAPMGFVVGMVHGLAEATMDFMMQDPAHAAKYCKVGFNALWRVMM